MASARGHPKVFSAWAFQSVIFPPRSSATNGLNEVSRICRDFCSLDSSSMACAEKRRSISAVTIVSPSTMKVTTMMLQVTSDEMFSACATLPSIDSAGLKCAAAIPV